MTKELIEDFRFIVIPYMVNRFKEINYEGQGGSDAEEFKSDFNEICDLAIKALEQESTTKNNLSVEESTFEHVPENNVGNIEPTTKNDLALIHTEGLDEGIRCAMCTNSIKSDRGCDGSCVVNNAMYKEVMDVIENHIVDTEKMIEPTTKNNLGVDCIVDILGGYTDLDIPYKREIAENILTKLPSVTPQEPRKGHWIKTGDYYTGAYGSIEYVDCSCCHESSLEEGEFCPNCGADMREVKE